MSDSSQRAENRLRFLKAIYDEVKGNPKSSIFTGEIAKRIGLENEEDSILEWAQSQGFLEERTISRKVGITFEGVEHIEETTMSEAEHAAIQDRLKNFLRGCYTAAQGRTTFGIAPHELGEKLGLDDRAIDLVVTRLNYYGFLGYVGASRVHLTAEGVNYAEEELGC